MIYETGVDFLLKLTKVDAVDSRVLVVEKPYVPELWNKGVESGQEIGGYQVICDR